MAPISRLMGSVVLVAAILFAFIRATDARRPMSAEHIAMSDSTPHQICTVKDGTLTCVVINTTIPPHHAMM